MKCWFICSFCLVVIQLVYGQTTNPVFRHRSRQSGLPVDQVTCLAQDSTGFIWIGSKEGLFRYDGFTYKAFHHQPGNDQTIPNNSISKIYVNKEGQLWVGTEDGLVLMDNNGTVICRFGSDKDSLFLEGSDIIVDIKEFNDWIWVSTLDGLYSIRKAGAREFEVKRHDMEREFGVISNQLGPFTIDKAGRFWICALKGLLIYDPQKNTLYHAGNNPLSLKIFEEKFPFTNIYLDEERSQAYYTTYAPAERIYDIRNNTIRTVYSGEGKSQPDYSILISQYLKDKHGTLWVGSGKGIKMISAGKEWKFHHQESNQFSLIHDQINSFLIDREENLWIGTERGISLIQPYSQSLVNITIIDKEQYPFARSTVNTIIPVEPDCFLIGTYAGDGLYRTDSSFHVLEHYSFGSSAYDWIWNYYKEGDSIFISTQQGNLIYHIPTKKIRKLTQPPFDSFFPIFSFVSDTGGGFWMNRYSNDFIHYDPKTHAFKKYGLTQLGESASVFKIAGDRDHNLWLLSSLAGVLKFDPVKEKITDRFPLNKQNGLVDTHIMCMADLGEEMIIGYLSHGFSLYNKKTKKFRHFSQANGLASNSVTDVLQTDNNTVWITTRNGISKLDLRTKTILSYGYQNGILQNDFVCIAQLPDGRLAAGSINGMISFYPEGLIASRSIRPPVITGFNIYGKDLPPDSIAQGHSYSIPYDRNYFSIDYISLQFNNYQQIEYAYKLEGFDKDWVGAGNRRFVSYSNLPGGHYGFKLRSRVPGGNWVENNKAIFLMVTTPFYLKWWFIPLCALVVLAIGFSLFRYRIQQLLRLEKMRQAISRDLHDEVGASLSTISIISEMARQSLPAGSKVENYLQRIGERSRESIERMSDIIWSINPANDSVQEMMVRMKTFVNETVEGKDINVNWHESERIQTLKLGMMQRKNFYLLFREAFINSIKYSNAKNIHIELDALHGEFLLKVSDDGIGFCLDTARQGNGIKNIRQRALFLGGKAVLESTPGSGTSLDLRFPY